MNNLHTIGTGRNEIIILETKPPVLYLVYQRLLAIPADPTYNYNRILPCFMNGAVRIGEKYLTEEWGWKAGIEHNINLKGYKVWFIIDTFIHNTDTSRDHGKDLLQMIKDVYDQNTKRK